MTPALVMSYDSTPKAPTAVMTDISRVGAKISRDFDSQNIELSPRDKEAIRRANERRSQEDPVFDPAGEPESEQDSVIVTPSKRKVNAQKSKDTPIKRRQIGNITGNGEPSGVPMDAPSFQKYNEKMKRWKKVRSNSRWENDPTIWPTNTTAPSPNPEDWSESLSQKVYRLSSLVKREDFDHCRRRIEFHVHKRTESGSAIRICFTNGDLDEVINEFKEEKKRTEMMGVQPSNGAGNDVTVIEDDEDDVAGSIEQQPRPSASMEQDDAPPTPRSNRDLPERHKVRSGSNSRSCSRDDGALPRDQDPLEWVAAFDVEIARRTEKIEAGKREIEAGKRKIAAEQREIEAQEQTLERFRKARIALQK